MEQKGNPGRDGARHGVRKATSRGRNSRFSPSTRHVDFKAASSVGLLAFPILCRGQKRVGAQLRLFVDASTASRSPSCSLIVQCDPRTDAAQAGDSVPQDHRQFWLPRLAILVRHGAVINSGSSPKASRPLAAIKPRRVHHGEQRAIVSLYLLQGSRRA